MDFSKPEDAISFASDALPAFLPTGEAQELSGGILNRVWRVFGEGRPVVLKHSPPYIARAPEIALSPRRILIEAEVLRLFERPPLLSLISDDIRPPRLLYADEKKFTIILEDVGGLSSLDEAETPTSGQGARLGSFIGRLHSLTFGNENIAEALDNREIQQSRLEVQYAPIRRLLEDQGIGNAAVLGRKARQMGEKYLSKGKCLIMGDLWPRSILADIPKDQIRVIDWEFAHYGRPAQDVAHLLAHLWMLQHRAGSAEKQKSLRQFQEAFVKNYRAATAKSLPAIFDEEEIRDGGIHFGAEILARTLGSFREGYLYKGLAPRHPVIREAVAMAIEYMESPGAFARLMEPLKPDIV